MGKSSNLKFSAWNDFSSANAFKAKSALQITIDDITAIIPITRFFDEREAITHNGTIIIIPEAIWIFAIYIIGIRQIAKATSVASIIKCRKA